MSRGRQLEVSVENGVLEFLLNESIFSDIPNSREYCAMEVKRLCPLIEDVCADGLKILIGVRTDEQLVYVSFGRNLYPGQGVHDFSTGKELATV